MVKRADAIESSDVTAVGSRAGGSAGLQVCEDSADLLLKGGDVEIADGHDRREFGAIPRVVKINESLARGFFDDGDQADRQTFGQQGVGEDVLELGDEGAEADGIARAFFAQNDAALFVDFGRIEEQAAGVIGKHAQALGERGRVSRGKLEHVNGLIERGESVGVAAEAHAHALEKFDERARGVVFAAVEGHVFEKVGDAALGLGFIKRAGPDVQPEGGAVFGLVVVEQRVADAVGQGAEANRRIGAQVAAALGEGGDRKRG